MGDDVEAFWWASFFSRSDIGYAEYYTKTLILMAYLISDSVDYHHCRFARHRRYLYFFYLSTALAVAFHIYIRFISLYTHLLFHAKAKHIFFIRAYQHFFQSLISFSTIPHNTTMLFIRWRTRLTKCFSIEEVSFCPAARDYGSFGSMAAPCFISLPLSL